MEPNLVAYAALVTWPLISLFLFQTRPLPQALIWTILGGYLLLPVHAEIKLEGIPGFNKDTIPNLAALGGCLLVARQAPRLRYGFGAAEVLLLMLVIGPLITSELNTDAIVVGGRYIPGVGHYDAASAIVAQLLLLIPFFLARQYLRDAANTVEVLRALVFGGMLYSIPMLFEIRMSPQLHSWIYGYFPHSFGQQMRDGGFRPVVFLGHGLLVALFIATSAIAASAFWRTGVRLFKAPASGVTFYLMVVVVLCKTMSALVYSSVLVPLVRFASPTLMVRLAVVFAAIALLYPTMRAAEVFPSQALVDTANSIDVERGESLGFRFNQEDQLLARAQERFWFGWGRFGRNRVFDETTGKEMSVTDGRWIITMGQFGFIGFLAEFGLLALSLLRAASSIRYAESSADAIFITTLALIVGVYMVDQLPNASLGPWAWLLSGALLGRTEAIRSRSTRRYPAAQTI